MASYHLLSACIVAVVYTVSVVNTETAVPMVPVASNGTLIPSLNTLIAASTLYASKSPRTGGQIENAEQSLTANVTDLELARFGKDGCKCSKLECGCCVRLNIKEVHFDETGCVTVRYLKADIGIDVTFSINNKVIINETVSAKNPPPICFGLPLHIPGLKLCIVFYNLDIHGGLAGCIKIRASAFLIFKEDFDIGCFKISAQKGNPRMTENRQELMLAALIQRQQHDQIPKLP